MKFRIGNGYDVHRFCEDEEGKGEERRGEEETGATITLGGVAIRHDKTLLAHSDGDVLIHALCDALLGALALGDIGSHFPDTDEQFLGISSLILLEKVTGLIAVEGWVLSNADITVVAEKPKVAPHREQMQTSLAHCMGVQTNQISIKATTTEGLGFTGRGEGIGVHAVVLLERIDD